MKRTLMRAITVPAVLAALALAMVGTAHAGPTCSEEMGIAVHGQHIVGDYVMGEHLDGWPPAGAVGEAVAGEGAAHPGAPGPKGHGTIGAAFGASFCNDQSQSPGWHF